MRSFVKLSSNVPEAKELQTYIKTQLEVINYNGEMVVSFIDTAHTFQYAFTMTEMDPAKLTGKSVMDIRDQKEIKKLDDLMKYDSLRLFYPMNLREGWLGIQ